MDDPVRPTAQSTALVPHTGQARHWAADPTLAAHLTRLAAASGYRPPFVIPGAAVRLINVALPLKTARQRRAALPFAIEESLAAGIDDCHSVVGPDWGGSTYLCAVANRTALATLAGGAREPGPILPDILAVPPPDASGTWSLWCRKDLVYLRFADGSGVSVLADALPDLWRTHDKPRLQLWSGAPPSGVDISTRVTTPPDLDPNCLMLDLRPEAARRDTKSWQRLGTFAAAVLGLTGALQLGGLVLETQALSRLADQRSEQVRKALDARGLPPSLVDAPTERLSARIAQTVQTSASTDPFLAMFSRTSTALAGTANLDVKTLRFDADAATLTVRLTAPDLDALQNAESALRSGGLDVISGAASRTDAGAEMELVLSEAM